MKQRESLYYDVDQAHSQRKCKKFTGLTLKHSVDYYLHPDFQLVSHWWFSLCSDVSSVFLSQIAFLEQFLPQIHHPTY